MLAAQEGTLTILMGSTPGHFEESPPWDIEWEPGGKEILDLKRPFEAKKGDDVDHFGPHKNEPGHPKISSVHAPQSNHHVPLASDMSSRAVAEIVQHLGLEAKREGVAVRVVLWQYMNKTLPVRTQPPCDESRQGHAHSHVRRSRALAPTRACTSNKAAPHAVMYPTQNKNTVRVLVRALSMKYNLIFPKRQDLCLHK
jgi:hypothetical protein